MAIPESRSLPSVAHHFAGRAAKLQQTYDRLLAVAGKLGPVEEDPKQTSIHLNRRTAFAGVAVRKDWLVLTLKSDHDIPSSRVAKREQTSAQRWHLEVKLADPKDVDRELAGWLREAYLLSA